MVVLSLDSVSQQKGGHSSLCCLSLSFTSQKKHRKLIILLVVVYTIYIFNNFFNQCLSFYISIVCMLTFFSTSIVFQSSRHEIWNQRSTSIASPFRLNFISPMCTSAQKRASAKTAGDDSKITIGPKTSELEKDGKESGVVYYGPISSTIKKVKLLSLSTCCLSVSLGPVITFMTSPDMNVIIKGGVAATVIFLSASTTGALHWFVSPYIHKLKWKPGSETFDVEMMSWLATYIPKTIKFSDVRPPETNRPFVTFKADGNFYFVDAEHCHDKMLLAMLTPQKPAQESAFKNL